MSDDSPTITQQYSFAVGEDGKADGSIEPAEESVETDLGTFGADLDHRERDSRIDQPEATSFGVDDRKAVTRNGGGEQHALFADTKDDQLTLGGERAGNQCLFESDTDEQDDRDDEHAEEPDTASANDDPTDTANEASPRAVATDGGQPVEEDDSDTDDCDEGVVVSIPRMELARIADALDAERRTIEQSVGTGHKTELLTEYVATCRNTLSILDETDDHAPLSRTLAASAADELQATSNTETGDYAEELQRLAAVLRDALDEQPPDAKHADSHGFAVGTRVEDRDADDPNPAVVVAHPDEPAYAREIPALDETVADVNPDYGASGPVTTVAYTADLDDALDVWHEADPDALVQICADEDVRTYEFPTARLREATMSDGGRGEDDEPTDTDEQDHNRDEEPDESSEENEDTAFDADAETVTKAWEGAFISARWGYNQTNVELAQIVEVSGSGKTVVARFVKAERVGHGRTSKQLRPTANQYGDEFRLHVRSGGDGDPMFRGSYPLGSDGDMDDGPTRRGWFSPFDNDPENSIRATRTGFGH